jgi:hypothetical protein
MHRCRVSRAPVFALFLILRSSTLSLRPSSPYLNTACTLKLGQINFSLPHPFIYVGPLDLHMTSEYLVSPLLFGIVPSQVAGWQQRGLPFSTLFCAF